MAYNQVMDVSLKRNSYPGLSIYTGEEEIRGSYVTKEKLTKNQLLILLLMEWIASFDRECSSSATIGNLTVDVKEFITEEAVDFPRVKSVAIDGKDFQEVRFGTYENVLKSLTRSFLINSDDNEDVILRQILIDPDKYRPSRTR